MICTIENLILDIKEDINHKLTHVENSEQRHLLFTILYFIKRFGKIGYEYSDVLFYCLPLFITDSRRLFKDQTLTQLLEMVDVYFNKNRLI